MVEVEVHPCPLAFPGHFHPVRVMADEESGHAGERLRVLDDGSHVGTLPGKFHRRVLVGDPDIQAEFIEDGGHDDLPSSIPQWTMASANSFMAATAL